jgi:hypothetical protein
MRKFFVRLLVAANVFSAAVAALLIALTYLP